MARPLRIEFPGAVYHLTSRGNARNSIYLDNNDRERFLAILGNVVERYNWLCHAFCLMDNHYHLLIETLDANLSLGMRQLNGVYTQSFNRAHNRAGHVFQGRYKSILVEKDQHLLELCRYIVLNPIRAGVTKATTDWKWSSYNATAYPANLYTFLTVDWVLGQFADKKPKARKAYKKFVAEGLGEAADSPWQKLMGQIVFGGDTFAAYVQEKISQSKQIDTDEISRIQRFPGRPQLKTIFSNQETQTKKNRNHLITKAHIEYGYTLKEIANHLNIHYTTVSKAMKVSKVRYPQPNKS